MILILKLLHLVIFRSADREDTRSHSRDVLVSSRFFCFFLFFLFIFFFLLFVFIVAGGITITTGVEAPPKNSRAAGLRSAEREQRDKERARESAMTFEDQKLQFEKDRAAFLQDRNKG